MKLFFSSLITLLTLNSYATNLVGNYVLLSKQGKENCCPDNLSVKDGLENNLAIVEVNGKDYIDVYHSKEEKDGYTSTTEIVNDNYASKTILVRSWSMPFLGRPVFQKQFSAMKLDPKTNTLTIENSVKEIIGFSSHSSKNLCTYQKSINP